MPNAALIRVTLLDLDPAPWREFEVPLSMSLKALHDTIQAAFLWHDTHLWKFDVEGRRFGPEAADDIFDDHTYKAADFKLTRLRELGFTDLLYVYDMGDDWRHRVQVLRTLDSDGPLPRLVAGKWRCPPEDVGGAPGFGMFLDALADPSHPQHQDVLDRHGGPFEPERIDEVGIEARMAPLRRGRRRRSSG
jgi:hypothetical protein